MPLRCWTKGQPFVNRFNEFVLFGFGTVQKKVPIPQHPKVPAKSEFTSEAFKGKDLSKTGGGWHWRVDMDSYVQISRMGRMDLEIFG